MLTRMARKETDKEDLLREATALVERVELSPSIRQSDATITAGFRPDGAASIFFGADPVYHFNATGELRRAYCDGLLFKAIHGRLVSLRRVRTQVEVELRRHELSDTEQQQLLMHMQNAFAELTTALTRGECKMIGQVPEDADVIGRLKLWLTRQDFARVAAAPHAQRSGK
jgi:hypothetical protein